MTNSNSKSEETPTESNPENETPNSNQQLPGYSADKSGLHVITKDRNGEEQLVWLCSELTVSACTRNDQQAGWGRLLIFKDSDGHSHSYNALMSQISGSGDSVISELMDRGLVVSQANGAKKLIIAYILHTQPKARARTVITTGWHDNQFVLPEQVIGVGSEILLYQQDSHATHAYHCRGTLQEWQQLVGRHCIGNSRLVFAVSIAFAATLLDKVNGESGGISITGGSSTGKTTALHVAASVCGSPDYLQRWRATSNGLEFTAMLHNHCVLILDELAQIDPREAGETAYMLANGAGKIRATKNGGVREKPSWQLLFLSAGEISLTDHMAAAGKVAKAGQEIRLVDVPADAGAGKGLFEELHGHSSGAHFSEALKLASSRSYGTPLIEFLQKLTQEDSYVIKAQLVDLQQQFINLLDLENAGGQARRVATRFALIAAGGELASSLGVTGWQAGEAIKASLSCFKAWVENREGTGQQEHRRILEQVSQLIEVSGESRFAPFDDRFGTTKIYNRAGFRKLDAVTGTYTYYILTSVWTKEVCNGFNPKDVATLLLNKGILEAGTDGKPYSTTRLPGLGVTKCYRVNSSVFSTEEKQATAAPAPSDEFKIDPGNASNTCNDPFEDDDIPF